VLGSAVCGSVTHRQDPSGGDVRTVAHRQSNATGLHAAPGPQRRPGVGFGPPAARLAGCNSAATARPAQPGAARARAVGRFPGPPAARRPWRSWAPAAGPSSVVTEVGCRWSSRPVAAVGNSPRPISSNAKVGPSGRGEWQPGMGMPEISMPSDAFCSGAHVTLAPHCVHSASRSKQTSIAKSKVPRL
jgi:hypothetical protein